MKHGKSPHKHEKNIQLAPHKPSSIFEERLVSEHFRIANTIIIRQIFFEKKSSFFPLHNSNSQVLMTHVTMMPGYIFSRHPQQNNHYLIGRISLSSHSSHLHRPRETRLRSSAEFPAAISL